MSPLTAIACGAAVGLIYGIGEKNVTVGLRVAGFTTMAVLLSSMLF